MALFSRFKRSTSTGIEKELEHLYTRAHQNLFGLAAAEARRTVRDAIKACRQKGRDEGTADLPENFGDFLLSQAREGASAALRIADKARKEGAGDEDIAESWNLNDLECRMAHWSELVIRYAKFLGFLEQGFDPDEATRKVRQMFPMYGDPLDTTHTFGDDRPLPHEVRGRVDEYRAKDGAASILKRSVAK